MIEETFLICGSKDEIPGSVTEKCGKCGAVVYRAPSSVEIIAKHPDVIFLCYFHGFEAMAKAGRLKVLPLTIEQLVEIAQAIDPQRN